MLFRLATSIITGRTLVGGPVRGLSDQEPDAVNPVTREIEGYNAGAAFYDPRVPSWPPASEVVQQSSFHRELDGVSVDRLAEASSQAAELEHRRSRGAMIHGSMWYNLTTKRQISLWEPMMRQGASINVPDYLSHVYNRCRQVRSIRDQVPYVKYEELRSKYAAPVLTYAPWVTSFPVIYITGGGSRQAKFEAVFKHFSANMHKIDAVVPKGDKSESKMKLVVDDPSKLIWLAKNNTGVLWKKVLGCILSHLKAIQLAWDAGLNSAIILEDDAVPMYPSWRTSLEEFVLTLPSDWEAVQLQWTVGINSSHVTKFNHTNMSRAWVPGRGWGTAAYILHRRAMKRLRDRLWNKETGRWRLITLARRCPMMSADDCLLGFSGYEPDDERYSRLTWFPDGTEALRKVFLSTPALFLHDSQLNPLHVRNYCQDIKENTRLFQDHQSKLSTERLLIFFSVNSARHQTSAGLQKTVEHLRKAGHKIFLAFDDAKPGWTTPSARKMEALWQQWKMYGTSWQERFDYIWAVDEDIPLDKVDLAPALKSVVESGAAIAAPTLSDASPSWDAPFRRFQRPEEDCKFRYTNYVEAVAPIFNTSVLSEIFRHYRDDLNSDRNITMGMELVWCRWVKSRLKTEKPCALLDQFTLKHNSGEDLLGSRALENRRVALRNFTQKNSQHLVNDGTLTSLIGQDLAEECVAREEDTETEAAEDD